MENNRHTLKALGIIPWFLLIDVFSIVFSMVFSTLVLLHIFDFESISDATGNGIDLGFGCAFIIIFAIWGIFLLILLITLSINMIKSRNERKELEKTGLIAGIILLSVFILGFLSLIPYVGDYLSGIMPLILYGAILVYYYNLIPNIEQNKMKFAITIVIFISVVVLIGRIMSVFELVKISIVVFLFSNFLSLILIALIYSLNKKILKQLKIEGELENK